MSLLLLFVNSSATQALTGQVVVARTGLLRPDWHIESQTGQPLVLVTVALVGLESLSAQGTVTADAGSPDKIAALSGLETVSAAGLVLVTNTLSATGLSSTSAAGVLHGDHDVAGIGLSSASGHGQLLPADTGSLSGLASAGASGTLALTSLRVLTGLESLGGTGLVSTSGDKTAALTGTALVASSGLLAPTGGDVGDDLLAFQRRRHFGRVSTPLVRQPYPRKVR